MSNIRFFLSIVRLVNADAVGFFLYSTLFTRSYQKPRPGSTREKISYVSLFLKKLMFKEIPLVFLFKVNRASSMSSVILSKFISKHLERLKKELVIRLVRMANVYHFVLACRRGKPYDRKDKLGFLVHIETNGKKYSILGLDYSRKLKTALIKTITFYD
jgi:hypothetical protein